MMLSSSGPANMPGNSVRTWIFMPSARAPSGLDPAAVLTRWLLFDDFQRATQAAFGTAGQQERANRIDRHALAPNDPANVLRIQPQFIDGRSFPFHGCDGHFIGMFDQPFDD